MFAACSSGRGGQRLAGRGVTPRFVRSLVGASCRQCAVSRYVASKLEHMLCQRTCHPSLPYLPSHGDGAEDEKDEERRSTSLGGGERRRNEEEKAAALLFLRALQHRLAGAWLIASTRRRRRAERGGGGAQSARERRERCCDGLRRRLHPFVLHRTVGEGGGGWAGPPAWRRRRGRRPKVALKSDFLKPACMQL